MWKSKSFMSEYWTLVNKLSINPFVMSQEEILWACHHLTQILLDLNLVQSEDLKLKRTKMNFLQNLATLPTQIIDSEGDWSKLQKVLKGLFPCTGKIWIYSNIRKQDWSVLQTEKLRATFPIEEVAVPKFKQLPENYR